MMHWYRLPVIGLLLSGIGLTIIHASTSEANPALFLPISSEKFANAALPQPPVDPPPPPSDRRPGGGLNPFKQACQSTKPSLTAIIPTNQHTLTAASHPTLLFYISDHPENIARGEFSILTADEKQRIFQAKFTLTHTPGIISISLPKLPQYALQKGQLYRWYFKLVCQSPSGDLSTSTSNLYVNGWIRRVLPSEPFKSESPSVWYYDMAATLANQLLVSPDRPELQVRWRSQLQQIGLEDLATVPLVGPVELSPP